MPGTSLLSLPVETYPASAFAGFDPESGFSIGNARAMIWLSQLAYETRDRHKLNAVLGRWGARLKDVRGAKLPLFEDFLPDISAVVAVRGPAVLVVCPGTEPFRLRNWIRNFEFVPDPDTGVHTGFGLASQALWDALSSEPKPLAGSALYFTGHSLGGALAALLALSAKDAGMPIRGVYTFGMPRVGGPKFADRYNDALGDVTFRLAYGKDLVSRVPPTDLPGGPFKHVGRGLVCPDGRFDPGRLSRGTDSDEPAIERDVRTTFERLRHSGLLDVLSLATSLRVMSGPRSPYEGFLGAIIGILPPPVRDHIPDRYWNALSEGTG
jgi:hypothetical protein